MRFLLSSQQHRLGDEMLSMHEREALLIIICIKYCVIYKKRTFFVLFMSLKKPLKKKYAVE